jgi:hypothetical protein
MGFAEFAEFSEVPHQQTNGARGRPTSASTGSSVSAAADIDHEGADDLAKHEAKLRKPTSKKTKRRLPAG